MNLNSIPDDSRIIRALTGRTRPANWSLRPMVVVYCFFPAFVILLVSALLNTEYPNWPDQFALSLCTFGALLILGDRPLLNPLQALVFLFHWWFAWGPAVCSFFFYVSDDLPQSSHFVSGDGGAILIVALGQLLFALCAALTLRLFRKFRVGLSFLLPEGVLYSPRTLVTYSAVAAAAYALTGVLGLFGIRAFEDVNFLGGQKTVSPLLAAIVPITQLGQFATVGLIGYLVLRRTAGGPLLKFATILTLLGNIAFALQSGSKTPIILPLFYVGLVYFTYRQRIPWTLCISLLAFYVVFVEPFVASSRTASNSQNANSSDDRVEIFRQKLREGSFAALNWREINIESPFRFIYSEAIQVAAISEMNSGPWAGESLENGFSTMVPRFLSPQKADSNMGNYFAHQLGEAGEGDETYNISITIPFEFVGNYGFVAGILSFGLLGFFWTAILCFLLSEQRLATHPLMPVCVTLIMTVEGSVGQMANGLKLLPIPILAAWVVFIAVRRKTRVSLMPGPVSSARPARLGIA